MDFTVTETIAASRDAVEAAMASPDYYRSLGDAVANLEAPDLLSAEVRDGSLHTSVRYRYAGDISGPATMAIDRDKLTWVINTEIDLSTHDGHLTVVPDHYDGLLRCSGTIRLDESDGITTETISGSLGVTIPLVGATAEKVILGGFTQHLEREATALAAFCRREA